MENKESKAPQKKDWNVGSSPGNTTIRNCGKQHSGTKIQTITSPLCTCINFKPKYSKPPQVNQTWFTEDVDGPHIKNHQEAP